METQTESPSRETHRFQAEVSQVLHLVIHSLYSHREVFLRELVSNASDAIDKRKFRAITEPSLSSSEDPVIRIIPNRDARTVTIEDDGVGMTRDELVKNLGTIAHSGSKKFLEALKAQGENRDLNLIGQFGVGFYSAWLVADRVEVISRAAGTDTAFQWRSDARDDFTVEPAERDRVGTSVILHLKPEQDEFLDAYTLRNLVTRYSDFVGHTILLKKEEPKEDEDPFEVVNQARALWQRPKSEITKEQYEEFYTHLTRDDEAPIAWTHFKVEGSQEFTGLIYIPAAPPFDLDTPGEGRRGVRLFVKRVFIMDNCDVMVPLWLRFVRGVLDSDDLPLNVSRETLQDSAVVRSIKNHLTRKTLDLLLDLAKDRADDYKRVWSLYGRVLKEGFHYDWEHREKLLQLVRFESSKADGITSLAEYVSRMPEGQESIYYALGESRRAISDSPHLEALRAKGYEVLYLTDLVDSFAVEGMREFQGKKLVSAQNADLKLDDTSEKKQERENQAGVIRPLVDRVRAVLGERIKDVRTSDRLTDSPACLIVPPGGLTPQMERMLRAQGRDVPPVKKVLEVNPTHPLITSLKEKLDATPDDPQLADWIEVLYDQALLTEGSQLDDPQRFAKRLTALLQKAVG